VAALRRLTWPEVLAARLARHALDGTGPHDPVEVVRAVCGLHAQVQSAAEHALALRCPEAARLDELLWQERTLVRTYGPRGTVHVLPSDELAVWAAALGEVARRGPRPRREDDPATMRAAGAAVGDAVAQACSAGLGGAPTRDEVGRAVVRRLGERATEEVLPAFGGRWPRWRVALEHAVAAGTLCFGPPRAGRPTFLPTDLWLGPAPTVDPEVALDLVLLRYLTAYGPVSAADLGRWLAVGAGPTRELLRGLGDRVEEVDVEGYRGWRATGGETGRGDAAAPPSSPVVVLAGLFDPYVVGCHPRDVLAAPAVAAAAGRYAARWASSPRRFLCGPLPVVLVDGTVAGVWARDGDGLVVDLLDTARPVSRRSLAAAAARLGERRSVRLGPAPVRPHL
jgi:hypothetical protein